MNKRWNRDALPPLNIDVECLLHYIPCPYYVKIGIRKSTDEKLYTGIYHRKQDLKMNNGYIWTDGVGSPTANVEGWRELDQQLSFNF